jgi:uncharacterized membrane protein YraQ (UPF0718 family)
LVIEVSRTITPTLTGYRLSPWLPGASRVAGVVVAACVGVAVLGGWILDIARLMGGRAGFATMKPNTALAFLLAGAALSLLAPRVLSPRASWWRARTAA